MVRGKKYATAVGMEMTTNSSISVKPVLTR